MSDKKQKRLLLLADQPFQLLAMSLLAKKLVASGHMVTILVTDLFTFIYGPNLISEAKERGSCEVLTLEDIFRSWQYRGEPPPFRLSQARKKLNQASSLTSLGRDFETLRLTDPLTNGFEFSSWYLHISAEWKDVAHADIITYLESLFTRIKPEIIVSIDHTQFATNILHAISSSKCKFITFQNARFGSRWVARFDLAFGSISDADLNVPGAPSLEVETEIDIFVEEFTQTNDPIYPAPSLILGEKFKRQNGASFLKFFYPFLREILDIGVHTIRSIVLGPRTRKIKVRRFDQNFIKINLIEAKRRISQFFPDSGVDISMFPSQSFFFWTLHYRPEGSGLVLGLGKDELSLVNLVAQELQESNQVLIVKENPFMYGTRNRKDIRRILTNSNVHFARRYSSSKNWIKNSRAVIGISGSSLLEAALLDVPSFAFGKPEFLSCVWSQNEMTFSDFVKRCTSNQIRPRKSELRNYMRYIFRNSTADDVMLNALTSTHQLNNTINRMASFIDSSLMNNDS